VLLANALAPHPSVPVIYGVGVVMAVAQSLQSPSREALVPRTVRHAELPAAVALSSVGAQVGMLGGPALGGVLLVVEEPRGDDGRVARQHSAEMDRARRS